MKSILTCLSLIVFSGCTTMPPVVKEAPKCDISKISDMLALCGAPAAIKPGITFGDMIEVARQDRENLRACALKHKSLADTITACNGSIDRYNAEIRDIDSRNPAKP